MENNMKEMNPILADFCGLLESHNVSYELNENDENMMRFRTKLPHHDTAPYVLVHYNPKNSALSLALSRIALFSSVGPDLYQIVNEFNADPGNFACKMFIDKDGQIIVLTNAILKGENTRDQVEDYLNICVLALDKYLGRILELINNNNNN
ncbi:YbjN domain-containing protein [Ruminococcus sp.]|uniref:YbjN domain-containing protein n=1 Tax=Ruminococcus sp. TaxID=41978 RepID=UPI001B55123B|nr:YbjN domain-containing protein [Ruminococcus sp.]MBP5433883.1 YbjN domain-containing protein [Ruminococcus sp.]